ncbi:MAG: dihydropteroate synthase, partial [Polyangiaceae bacterium]|nr:dihydropteroate synthase [Polyangiaceae bacterium]
MLGGGVARAPLIMGVVNTTPDSFSDGGMFLQRKRACEHVDELLREGADLIDIGGESTRPGSGPVPADE